MSDNDPIADIRGLVQSISMQRKAALLNCLPFVFLISCQAPEPTPSALSVPPNESCEMSGGTIEKVGLDGRPACVILTSDGGKACSDSSQCDGRCIVDDWEGDKPPSVGTRSDGMCEAANLTFGCIAEIRRGRIASLFLCYD